jgi:excisionase family DNA binding protein
MTVHDTAIYLGFSENAVRELVKRGVLPGVGAGDGLRLPRASVEAYRNSGREPPGDGEVNDLVRDNRPLT